MPRKSATNPATPLQSRVIEVLDDTGMSARAWSLKAGLSQSMVGQILRGELQGNSARGTWTSLANAAGVSVDWLADGIGPKHGRANTETRLETTPRYSNLERVIEYWSMKTPARWSDAAIAAVRATANHESEDLSADAWEERLDAVNGVLRGRLILPDETDSVVPRRGARNKK